MTSTPPESDSPPASYFQEDLFLSTESRSSAYNVLSIWHASTADLGSLRAALQLLGQRHEILRTHFSDSEGDVRLVVAADCAPDIWTADLSECSSPHSELRTAALTDVGAPFDLRTGPLWRAGLVTLSDATAAVIVTAHHSVADAWSLAIARRDAGRFLAASAAGTPHLLPSMELEFGDFAAWERDEHDRRTEEAWRSHLSSLPHPPALPLDASWEPGRSFHLASSPFKPQSPALLYEAARLAKEHDTKVPALIYAAVAATVAPYVVGGEVMLGVAYSNRHREELATVVGPVFDYLPLRVSVSLSDSFASLLDRVAAELKAAKARCLPLGRIAAIAEVDRPLFDVLVNVMPGGPDAPPAANGAVPALSYRSCPVQWLRVPVERPFYGAGLLGYVIRLHDLGGQTYTPSEALPSPERDALGRRLRRVLTSAVEDPTQPLGSLHST